MKQSHSLPDVPRDNFRALYETSQTINSILDASVLLDKVLEIGMKHLDAERGAILLLNPPEQDGFEVVTERNFSDRTSTDRVMASSSVVQKVLASGEPVLTFDALSDERFEDSRSIASQRIHSILCIPLRLREKVTGAIYLDSTKARGKFNEEALKFLGVFGNLAGIAIENARRYEFLRRENERLRSAVGPRALGEDLIGESKKWKMALELVQRVLDNDISVLLTGESGTGKEVVARAIHRNSPRSDKPFVAVNCSSIPEHLLESELFGYRKGAFTGAVVDKKGLIEFGDGGTLFLDEIGDIPLSLQAKLLRALQEREIRRVGDLGDRKVDVRVIAASNKNLREEVKKGAFREDLFFRLNVVEIDLPPLRERREDIPLLADYFLTKALKTHGRGVKKIAADAMDRLLSHSWPGNVRELNNAIERAVVLSQASEITATDFRLQHFTEGDLLESGLTLEEFERKLVERTLREMNGNRTRTAEKLGISLRWLQYRLKEWNVGQE